MLVSLAIPNAMSQLKHVKDNMFMVTGEITFTGKHETVVRDVIHRQTDQVIDVPVLLVFRVPQLRVMEQTVETLKSQCFDEESALLADNKLTSKLDGSCAAQAPEWEELQRLRAEELVAIFDINKLQNDCDSLELFKETLPRPIMMQVQSDKREVARRPRAVVRNSSGSSRNVRKVTSRTEDVVSLFQQEQDDDDNKKTSCLIDIGRAEDADTSLAVDTKSHESAIADPTAAAQHRSTQQHNYHRKQWQSAGLTEEGGKGRRKEKERETEVKKDVTDWTVVTRNRRQRKMIQIFVKVNGSKTTPMEVNLTDDNVEDMWRRIQKDEDVYVTMHGRVPKRSERLKSCEVTDGCTIQVTDRLRGGGRHKDKRSRAETRQGMDASGQKDQQVGLSVDKYQEMTQAQKDVVFQPWEADETYQRMIRIILEARVSLEERKAKKRTVSFVGGRSLT